MIIVAGTFRLAAESQEAAQTAALKMMHATQAEEGCQTYQFSADLEEPGVFHLFEVWDSDQALQAHFETPHMAEFRAVIGSLDIRSREITRYVVSESSAL